MANNENLQKFTKENAKEYGKRGGLKSGEVRAERRTLKEQIKMLLEMPITDETKIDKLAQMGFNESEMNNQAYLICALFEKAVSGDAKAMSLILSTIKKEDEEKANILNDAMNEMFKF